MTTRRLRWNPAYLLAVVIFALLQGCATHRLQDAELLPDYHLPPAESGSLFRLSESITATTGEDFSVFLPLPDNADAMRWRLLLVDLAQQSIDAQYYLWNGDETGKLLAMRLYDAANRGVQVRLLVDDVFLLSADDDIVLLDRHPNIEVRVFNPWQKRGSVWQRGLEFLGFANKLNQRMHNKLLVADNRFAIVGGRNIGNAYFGLSRKYNFRDLELVCAGPVTEDISASFDVFWNDDWATPGEAFERPGRSLPPPGVVREEILAELDESDRLKQADFDNDRLWERHLEEFIELATAGQVWVVYDDPPSAFENNAGVRKIQKLRDIDVDISSEMLIASAYFIPTQDFMERLMEHTKRGVRIRVLTNSLASTNHTMVNSGYAPWRRKLIEAGVELYEYRRRPGESGEIELEGIEGRFVTLHTKAFVIDSEYSYVGSLNMDPRSMHINSEMGLLVYDPELADRIADLIEHDMQPENAWRVDIDENNRLTWTSSAGTVYRQPARHFGQRIADFFYGLLPLEDQL
jgi:putative cardiolipin synthase